MQCSIDYQFTDNTSKTIENLRAEASSRVREIGKALVVHLQASLVGPRTGRFYLIPGTNRLYQASAPGEYPAFRTGDLLGSVRMAENGANTVTVGTHMPYGPKLEFAPSSKGGRPWLYRALRENQQIIAAIWEKPWKV